MQALDVSETELRALERAAPRPECLLTVWCDVRQDAAQAAAFQQHMARWKRLDAAILNAGVGETGTCFAHIAHTARLCRCTCAGVTAVVQSRSAAAAGDLFGGASVSDWQACLDVDLRAVLVGVHLATRCMTEDGGGGGAIVSVASAAGVFPLPHAPVYCAAKGGLVHFTRSAAPALLVRHGVRLATVCPQFVDTAFLAQLPEKERVALTGAAPLLRVEAVVDEIEALLATRERNGVAAVMMQTGKKYDLEALKPPVAQSARAAGSPPAGWARPALPDAYRRWEVRRLSREFTEAAELARVPLAATPRDGHVIVRRHVVGINASDTNFTSGMYHASAAEARAALPFVAGFESVGVVVRAAPGCGALGSCHKAHSGRTALCEPAKRPSLTDMRKTSAAPCAGLQEGQPVATLTYGGFSEYAEAKSRACTPIPRASPEAVAFLTSGLTASIALEEGGLRRGDTVLVTAAAGGTGMFAVQLANIAGAHVIGTCSSAAKAALLRRLGVDRVVDYKRESLKEVRCHFAVRGVLGAPFFARSGGYAQLQQRRAHIGTSRGPGPVPAYCAARCVVRGSSDGQVTLRSRRQRGACAGAESRVPARRGPGLRGRGRRHVQGGCGRTRHQGPAARHWHDEPVRRRLAHRAAPRPAGEAPEEVRDAAGCGRTLPAVSMWAHEQAAERVHTADAHTMRTLAARMVICLTTSTACAHAPGYARHLYKFVASCKGRCRVQGTSRDCPRPEHAYLQVFFCLTTAASSLVTCSSFLRCMTRAS